MLTRSVTSTQRFLVPRCPRCGLTPAQRWRKECWERQLGKGLRTLAQTYRHRDDRNGGRDWAGGQSTLTIGCPQLGLQWTQGRARREVGSQVEFPLGGTVLREGQAGSQVLQPVGEESRPAGSTQTPETPSKPSTTGVIPRGKQGVPRVTGGRQEERREGRGVREGQSSVPYTPACVLSPQSSVQQEDGALR